jgi:hypothetical protein
MKTAGAVLLLTLGLVSTASAQSGGGVRVPVCHQDGQARTRLIFINGNAVPAHLQHGDSGLQTFYQDADGDGFGDPATGAESCGQPVGFVANSDDCNDAVPGKTCFEQNLFAWEVSTDGGTSWFPVTLPDTNWGCSFCTRLYRTFVTGVPSSVTFRWASDNEARMFVNGTVVYDDYFINNADWCTQAPCCSECGDTPANANNVIANQTPILLSPADLAVFTSGVNEIRWQVNQQTGGTGFHTEMTAVF